MLAAAEFDPMVTSALYCATRPQFRDAEYMTRAIAIVKIITMAVCPLFEETIFRAGLTNLEKIRLIIIPYSKFNPLKAASIFRGL